MGYQRGAGMATIPQARPKKRTDEELAAELHRVIEGHFDRQGLDQNERDKNYAKLKRSLNVKDASRARS
jgi:hypothetical protein